VVWFARAPRTWGGGTRMTNGWFWFDWFHRSLIWHYIIFVFFKISLVFRYSWSCVIRLHQKRALAVLGLLTSVKCQIGRSKIKTCFRFLERNLLFFFRFSWVVKYSIPRADRLHNHSHYSLRMIYRTGHILQSSNMRLSFHRQFRTKHNDWFWKNHSKSRTVFRWVSEGFQRSKIDPSKYQAISSTQRICLVR